MPTPARRKIDPVPLTRRKKRLLAAAGALLLAPLLAFLVGEVYVRLRHPAYADMWAVLETHPVWTRSLRPGAEGRLRALTGEYDHPYAISAEGLREPGPLGPKGERPRVLCLGDSNTFGLGVADDAVWVRRLEAAGVEPVNAGWASGYAPDSACLFLEGRGLDLEPDVVLHALTPANDLSDMGGKNVWVTDPDGRLVAVHHRQDWAPDWLKGLAFPRFLYLQVLPALRGGGGGGGGPRIELSRVEERGLERLARVLPREREACAARGVRLIGLVFPSPALHLPDRPEARRRRAEVRTAAVADALADAGVEAIGLDDAPELTGAEGPLFYARDGHMTPAGNAAVGRAVARILSARLAD